MSTQLPLSGQHQQTFVSTEMPVTYLHFNSGQGKPLLILLHGYSDTAAGFLKRAFSNSYEDYEVLAPNGLFPVPVKIESGWKRTFAWYFADYSKKEVLIPPTVAAQAVKGLIEKLNLQDRPKVLLGFSQGGFFLPFLLPELRNVKKMFAIGAAYRSEDYSRALTAPLDALHGEDDQVVEFQKAKHSFDELKKLNPQGKFHSFKGLGHTMNDEARTFLRQSLSEVSFS